jgi:hydroxymethylpyrimidine pyrophosphatase-like HAD family hydrolase
MAFGDYMNDIEMLKNSKFSYAMQNAHPFVKKMQLILLSQMMTSV